MPRCGCLEDAPWVRRVYAQPHVPSSEDESPKSEKLHRTNVPWAFQKNKSYVLTNTLHSQKFWLSCEFLEKKAVTTRSPHWFNVILNSFKRGARLINWDYAFHSQDSENFTRLTVLS